MLTNTDGDQAKARRNYHGQIKPSDRVVYIGWQDGHDIKTETPAASKHDPDEVELVEITAPVPAWSKQNSAA